jgi:hypothetical protein
MPFDSKKQFRYLAINEPEVFKKFKAEDKREFKDLPESTMETMNMEKTKIVEMPYLYTKGKDLDLEFEGKTNDQIIDLIVSILEGRKYKDKYGNEILIKTWDDKTNFLDTLRNSSQYRMIINSKFSSKEKELMDIMINHAFKESKKKTGNKIKEEESEIGLISNKNLDELLNDKEIKSYFTDVENFDKYYNDITDFFKSDNALTINQLNQYLDNLGYGPKCIEKSIEILSKSDEERKEETKVNTPKETIKNSMKKFNEELSKQKDPEKLIEILDEMNEMIISSKILENFYEDEEKLNQEYNEIKESDPSLKPPKRWWTKMRNSGKSPALIGSIWSNLSTEKKSEIRGREGKTYGPAPKKD